MDLRKTITDFEQKAAEYTAAADSLRALLAHEGSSVSSVARTSSASAPTASAPASSAGKTRGPGRKPGRQPGKRGAVSPETRAKIAAAMRAKHQARKAAAGA